MGYGRAKDIDIPNVEHMLRGRTCQSVHVHCKKYEGDAFVLHNAQDWLDDRWREKDEMLHDFIEQQKFRVGDEDEVS